ncbi:ABC transporter ATP-binding protein, partial [Vibrio parahaemolyticus]
MDILIDNFGTIKHAHVKIGGLTVIAGENDTGKSTVGKLLFSLIKANTRYEENLVEDRDFRTKSIIERIYFNVRRHVNISNHIELREIFH